MRAGFLIGLNEFEIREMDVPQCHQNEVIVKVEASGICGSDIHKMSKGWKYQLPMIMGHEMAGTIVKVGRSVHHLKKTIGSLLSRLFLVVTVHTVLSGSINYVRTIS